MVSTLDARADLLGCDIPMLYLAASRDLLVSELRIDEFRAHPGVELRTILAPHMLLQIEPELAAREILEFLGRQNSPLS